MNQAGAWWGGDNFPHTLDADENRGGEQGQRDDHASDGLRLAVAVGMVLIRWQGGNLQAGPHHEGTHDVTG